MLVPGAPATDRPVDAGGPTAQTELSSYGTSRGYAAHPNPGDVVITAPGLIAGFGGPSNLPQYPLYVASDAQSNPKASAGQGPYQLSAESRPRMTTARASTGVASDAVGNIALVTSTATVEATADGVTAQATSDTQGLTVGPLAIARITSTATRVLDPTGRATSSTHLALEGVRVGGVAVAIDNGGVNAAGQVVPLPLNQVLAGVLAGARISVAVLPAQEAGGSRVQAPAIRVTVPFDGRTVGSGEGTLTMTFGEASVSLASSAAPDSVLAAGVLRPTSAGPPAAAGAGAPALGSAAPATGGQPATSDTGAGSSALQPAALGTSAEPLTKAIPSFDIRSLYLMVGVGALAALGSGQLLRLLGVR
jgi:hypothetical protein